MENIRIADIIDGIEEERSNKEKAFYFLVKKVKSSFGVVSVQVDLDNSKSGSLDEELEGCKVGWKLKKSDKIFSGYGEILAVSVENEEVHIRNIEGELIIVESELCIFPKRYLEELENCWKNPTYSKSATYHFNLPITKSDTHLNIPKEFFWLREKQRESFNVFQYNKGIIWGPPGTGKTTLLGTILSTYMKEYPNRKILLMSLTNTAVDQILLSTHKSLETISSPQLDKCARVGSMYIAEQYKDKKYLVTFKQESLFDELQRLEREKPDKDKDIALYNIWLKDIERVKKEMKASLIEILQSRNLIAMTTTRAIFDMDTLLSNHFDLVVFDEASQISLAQVIMLGQIGKQVIYTGDPEQLSPIVTSSNTAAKEWIGNSIFKYKSFFKESMVFLNEQSRMRKEICKIVSTVFYNKELVVAKKLDGNWEKERELKKEDSLNGKSVVVKEILGDGTWSQKYRGNIRYKSAEEIVALCRNMADVGYKKEDILILVPFKAQKNLIKTFLRMESLSKIKVQTVHKSQGSEYHTIIFDPVVGNSDFLKSEDSKRLINVALSRAKTRLVLLFSSDDLNNETLKKIDNIVKIEENSNNPEIERLKNNPNFPYNLVGTHISVKNAVGSVLSIENGGKHIKIFCNSSKKERIFLIEKLFS